MVPLRRWNNRDKSYWHKFLSFSVVVLIASNIGATIFFGIASSGNYPGSDALLWLQVRGGLRGKREDSLGERRDW